MSSLRKANRPLLPVAENSLSPDANPKCSHFLTKTTSRITATFCLRPMLIRKKITPSVTTFLLVTQKATKICSVIRFLS